MLGEWRDIPYCSQPLRWRDMWRDVNTLDTVNYWNILKLRYPPKQRSWPRYQHDTDETEDCQSQSSGLVGIVDVTRGRTACNDLPPSQRLFEEECAGDGRPHRGEEREHCGVRQREVLQRVVYSE